MFHVAAVTGRQHVMAVGRVAGGKTSAMVSGGQMVRGGPVKLAHTRSDDGVGAVTSYSRPSRHCRHGWHTRCDSVEFTATQPTVEK